MGSTRSTGWQRGIWTGPLCDEMREEIQEAAKVIGVDKQSVVRSLLEMSRGKVLEDYLKSRGVHSEGGDDEASNR